MLNKKQYLITLGSAVATFIVVFVVAYFISVTTNANEFSTEINDKLIKEKQLAEAQSKILRVEEMRKENPIILPNTKVTLELKDESSNITETIQLETKTLLGSTKDIIQDRFSECTVETFCEDEVVLVRTLENNKTIDKDDTAYVIAVEDSHICIKEQTTGMVCGYISKTIDDLSSYWYSEFLREQIIVSEEQKDRLLIDPSFLQVILQDYDSE